MSSPARATFLLAHRRFLHALHVHRTTGDPADSAPLMVRALLGLFRSILQVHGESVDEPEAILARIAALNQNQSIFRYRIDEQWSTIRAIAAEHENPVREPGPEERARYDEIMRFAGDVFVEVDRYRRRRERDPRLGRIARRGAGVLAVVAAGALLVSYLHRRQVCDLPGAYYPQANFTGAPAEKTDCNIDFDWGEATPVRGFQPDGFSARWRGVLVVPEDATYTFILTSDDGSRLYLGGALLIDNWGVHALTTKEATIDLKRGKVPIRVDYFEEDGLAQLHLTWQSPTLDRAVIPASAFERAP